jgi:guanylate kinase
MILNISGGGGSGKSTIAEHLESSFPAEFRRVISYTNRPPRIGEVDGKDYHFVPSARLVPELGFVLQRIRGSSTYAILKSDLEESQHCLITTLPPRGVVYLESLGFKSVCVHLELSVQERRARMERRGDVMETISKRIEMDEKECSLAVCHEILNNHELHVLNARESLVVLAEQLRCLTITNASRL